MNRTIQPLFQNKAKTLSYDAAIKDYQKLESAG